MKKKFIRPGYFPVALLSVLFCTSFCGQGDDNRVPPANSALPSDYSLTVEDLDPACRPLAATAEADGIEPWKFAMIADTRTSATKPAETWGDFSAVNLKAVEAIGLDLSNNHHTEFLLHAGDYGYGQRKKLWEINVNHNTSSDAENARMPTIHKQLRNFEYMMARSGFTVAEAATQCAAAEACCDLTPAAGQELVIHLPACECAGEDSHGRSTRVVSCEADPDDDCSVESLDPVRSPDNYNSVAYPEDLSGKVLIPYFPVRGNHEVYVDTDADHSGAEYRYDVEPDPINRPTDAWYHVFGQYMPKNGPRYRDDGTDVGMGYHFSYKNVLFVGIEPYLGEDDYEYTHNDRYCCNDVRRPCLQDTGHDWLKGIKSLGCGTGKDHVIAFSHPPMYTQLKAYHDTDEGAKNAGGDWNWGDYMDGNCNGTDSPNPPRLRNILAQELMDIGARLYLTGHRHYTAAMSLHRTYGKLEEDLLYQVIAGGGGADAMYDTGADGTKYGVGGEEFLECMFSPAKAGRYPDSKSSACGEPSDFLNPWLYDRQGSENDNTRPGTYFLRDYWHSNPKSSPGSGYYITYTIVWVWGKVMHVQIWGADHLGQDAEKRWKGNFSIQNEFSICSS